jgi:hypothetical protein
MGQYHYVVNLDKHEYVHPHKLGCGLKLWEQLANSPSTGTALIVLLASASNGEGCGDITKGPTIIGAWRGDRITMVGDYDDKSSYPVINKDGGVEYMSGAKIYDLCAAAKDFKEDDERIPNLWTDVTDEVCAVIESELDGEFVGDGWRDFKRNEEKAA